MASHMTLRPARADDTAALAALGRDSFVAKFGTLYSPADLARFLRSSHSEIAVSQELADPAYRIVLAERDSALAGFLKLVMRCGWPEHARGHSPIELKQLYTAPSATGQGIGAALMDRALAEAGRFNADEIQLSVWSGNDGAQRFYRRYGFAKVADIEFWVGEQCDDEFLFAKML